MTGCVSNFGNHHGIGLRYESHASLAQTIIKGETTAAELTKRYGRFTSVSNPPNDTQNWRCVIYREVKMPFYNFLPTNCLYMSTAGLQYRLCLVSDQNGVVQDYAFDKNSDKHKTVLSGFIE